MKKIKIVALSLFTIIGIAFVVNYPKLKLISGYAAKNMASSYFLAGRGEQITNEIDNGAFLPSLAKSVVDTVHKSVTSTVFGMSPSTAVYREGVGAVLVPQNNSNISLAKPNRFKTVVNLPYPYGHLPSKDTIFANIDYSSIQNILKNAFEENYKGGTKNTRSVLILYKGHIVGEKYATDFNKHSLLQGWSITKSLITTCFGILEKDGYDIYKPITAFPHWQNDDRKNITTNHLLQMESGLKWEENYSKICDVTKMLFDDTDCTFRAIKKPLIDEPGSVFNYHSLHSNILSKMLRIYFNNDQEYLDFPYRELIDKIGMHSMIMETDAMGNYVASSYSWATTRDWAKFGQLFLQKGQWNGEQILSKGWTNYVATPNTNSRGEFGGQWWLNDGNYMPNVPKDCFYADGFEGQRIFVIPSKDLVVVRFGNTRLKRTGFYPLFDKMLGGICRAID